MKKTFESGYIKGVADERNRNIKAIDSYLKTAKSLDAEDIRPLDDLKIMLGDKFEQTLYQSTIDCLKLIADLEKENKILKSNALNNDKVVNKANEE